MLYIYLTSLMVRLLYLFSGSWWRKNRHPAPVVTCANSLDNVHCSSKYHIHFKNAAFYSTSTCDNIQSENCTKDRLKNNCNEKRRCTSDKTNTSCLYHKRSAIIQYACTGKQFKYFYWFIMFKVLVFYTDGL